MPGIDSNVASVIDRAIESIAWLILSIQPQQSQIRCQLSVKCDRCPKPLYGLDKGENHVRSNENRTGSRSTSTLEFVEDNLVSLVPDLVLFNTILNRLNLEKREELRLRRMVRSNLSRLLSVDLWYESSTGLFVRT